MVTLNGTGVSSNISAGKIKLRGSRTSQIKKYQPSNINSEILRLQKSISVALQEINSLREQALQKLGENEAEIFKMHEIMINDSDYQNHIVYTIKEKQINAESAVQETCEVFKNMFLNMQDEYLRARSVDIQDISERIVQKLMNLTAQEHDQTSENTIILAQDLTPSEVTTLDPNKTKGIITCGGSLCSHAAIIAKVMGIPMITGIGNVECEKYDDLPAIIDCAEGKVFINPNQDVIAEYSQKWSEQSNKQMNLNSLKTRSEVCTIDGQKIEIFANINNPNEIDEILSYNPQGIGLFRTEFLYMQNQNFPSEETQFEVYKNIAEKMQGKKIIIRTLDIGSDKQTEYMNMPHEINPAMGYRGIRVCLNQPDIFKSQLRAIYRASIFGNISLMLPMITSLQEVLEAKKIINEVKNELSSENIKYSKDVQVGIMIETPAAAVMSNELAANVDFFSIGTNDLTQYTLAIDRQNSTVGHIFDSKSKAVLKLISYVVKNAHANNISVGICGEMAGDETLTQFFLAMGIDELSMTANSIPNIRNAVLSTDLSKCKNEILKKLS